MRTSGLLRPASAGALRHNGKPTRLAVALTNTPAMKAKNNAIGETDKTDGGQHLAGFVSHNNVSPCTDPLVSMYRLENWGKQVFVGVLSTPSAGASEHVFCRGAVPTSDASRYGSPASRGGLVKVRGRSPIRPWSASATGQKGVGVPRPAEERGRTYEFEPLLRRGQSAVADRLKRAQ